MNFVSDLSLDETFSFTQGGCLQSKEMHTYARFYIFKSWRQLYAHHGVYVLNEEDVDDEPPVLPNKLTLGLGWRF